MLASEGDGTKANQDAAEELARPRQRHGASFADSLFDSSVPLPPTYAAARTSQGRPSHRFSTLYPLLGLQVAERAYVPDYGVWGREAYVRNFWKCVNWGKVEAEFDRRAQAGMKGTLTGL